MTGRVSRLWDGQFCYGGRPFGGVWTSAGCSAVLEVGPVSALVMSEPTYDWGDEQYRAAGLDPAQARFVGVKNPMNYRFAFRDVMSAAFLVRTPGPTPATVRHLPYRRITRPSFPFDDREAPWRVDLTTSSRR